MRLCGCDFHYFNQILIHLCNSGSAFHQALVITLHRQFIPCGLSHYLDLYDARHEKTDLKVFVVVMGAHPYFGMKPTFQNLTRLTS